MDVLIFIVAFGLFALFVAYSKRQSNPMASQLGLAVKQGLLGKTTLGGMIDGVHVDAKEHVRPDNRRLKTWHTVTVTIPCNLPDALEISAKGVAAGLGKMIGLQDIVVGHTRLDDLVVIKGRNQEQVTEFFSRPYIADATFSIFDRYGDLKFSKNRLFIQRQGAMTAITEQMIVSLVEYVNTLSGKHAFKNHDNQLIEAGLSDMSFEDNARFIQQEIARRKAGGSSQPASFDHHVPQMIEEPPPAYQIPNRPATDDYVAPNSNKNPAENDGSW